VYLNFGLWGISLLAGWIVIWDIGTALGDTKVERDRCLVDPGTPQQEEERKRLSHV
jgi:hypothetical protein